MAVCDAHIQGLMKAFDAPWPGLRGKFYEIKSEDLSLTIYPEDGARVSSIKYKGTEILRQYNKDRKAFQYGCFPMVPFVGRVKDGDIKNNNNIYHLYQNKGKNAMHGMAHFETWNVDEITENSIKLSVDISYPWPWKCKACQEFKIENNTIQMSLTLCTDKGTFPADVGWHPWFLKNPFNEEQDSLSVEFYADSMEEIVDELPTTRKLAVGPGPYDDCFNFSEYNAGAILHYKDHFNIEIMSNCPALIVFDKQPDATCVNTMTGVPNGVNTNPHFVTPISPVVAKSKWVFY